MSEPRPSQGARLVMPAITLVCCGLFATAAFVHFNQAKSSSEQLPEPSARLESTPDRFVSLMSEEESPHANPDAGEGAKAKKEEGKTGLGGGGVVNRLGGPGTKGIGSGRSSYRSGGGTFGAVARTDGGGIGGLIGTKGTQMGSGGLGSRGSGLGTKGLQPMNSNIPRTLPQSVPNTRVSAGHVHPDPKTRGLPPLTQTADDAQSTFAADVDTGSYTYARRMLRAGSLPSPDTVRVEEFINYFRYDYAQPQANEALGVTTELVAHPTTQDRHLLTIGVQAKSVSLEDRKPVRLTFLVDTSGSMRGADRLGLAQRAMNHALLGLGDEDTVAIVTYAGSIQVALPPTPASRRATIRGAIQGLRSGGGTAMDSGMALAYQQAEASYADGAENRVIVMSDGDANIGRTSADDMLKTIRRHAEGGITLTTMGFGTGNYKDARMEQLADAGDGTYVYIDGWKEAQRVFGEQLGATLETVGRDVKLQVEFDPARVKGWRQVGYVNRQIADQDFRNDAVDAGEVGSGHQVTALYELDLKAGAESVGNVHLRVKPPGPDRPAKEWTAHLSHTTAPRPSADTRTALAAMHLADGLYNADADSLKTALRTAESLQSAGREGASELAELARLALSLVNGTPSNGGGVAQR